jgi:hypothetical protein
MNFGKKVQGNLYNFDAHSKEDAEQIANLTLTDEIATMANKIVEKFIEVLTKLENISGNTAVEPTKGIDAKIK